MQREELNRYLDGLLEISRFRDYCPNGLQVEGRGEIRRIVSGVTASLDLIQAALADGADAILVHHGYFWKGEDPCLTGARRARIGLLVAHELSLFAYHLPLDAHVELGNNAQLGKRLGLVENLRAAGACAPGNSSNQARRRGFSRCSPKMFYVRSKRIQVPIRSEPGSGPGRVTSFSSFISGC